MGNILIKWFKGVKSHSVQKKKKKMKSTVPSELGEVKKISFALCWVRSLLKCLCN